MLREGAHGSLLQSFIGYFLRLSIGVLFLMESCLFLFLFSNFGLWKQVMHKFSLSHSTHNGVVITLVTHACVAC